MRGAKPGERRGGRAKGVPNKATRDIKALAAPYAPEALETLAKIMRTGESEQARVAASRELLDRGFGKAAQAVTGENGTGPVKLELSWQPSA